MAYGDILIVGDSGRVYRYSNGAWDAGIAVPIVEDFATMALAVRLYYRRHSDRWDTVLHRVYRYSNGAWDARDCCAIGGNLASRRYGGPCNRRHSDHGNASSYSVYRYSNGAWDAGIEVINCGRLPIWRYGGPCNRRYSDRGGLHGPCLIGIAMGHGMPGLLCHRGKAGHKALRWTLQPAIF